MPQNSKVEHHKNGAKQVIRAEQYTGIIPSSSEFLGYENTLKGSADRILKLAEQQQSHLIDIQNKTLENNLTIMNLIMNII